MGSVPAAAEEVVAGAEVVTVEVDNVVPGAVVVGSEVEDHDELTTTPPGPAAEVVSEPLSTYTPLKYKSSVASAWPVTGSSRTPRCQSSPFEEADTLTAGTVRVKSSEPVECQNATEPALKSWLAVRMTILEVLKPLMEHIQFHRQRCARYLHPSLCSTA